MRKILIASLFFLALGACAKPALIPDEELKTYTTKKLLEVAAERYVNNDYESAIYYYNKLIELFPEDNESVSWANYEIGFIYFVKKKYSLAITYFDKVLQIETLTHAPQILAANMKRVIAEQ